MKNILLHYIEITNNSDKLSIIDYNNNLDHDNFLNIIIPTNENPRIELFDVKNLGKQEYLFIEEQINKLISEL